MKKILAVGTLPPPIGGTSMSFQDFVNMLEQHGGVEHLTLDSVGLRNEKGSLSVSKFISFVFKLKRYIQLCDVVTLHLSYQALTLVTPFAVLFCKLYGKKLVIRRFGGVLHNEMSVAHRAVLNFALKHSAKYLVETKRQVKELNSPNVEFYPTGRNKNLFKPYYSPPKTLKKVSFISQVKKNKGIFELIHAIGKRSDLRLEIYGPLFDDITKHELELYPNVKYLGVVVGEDVKEVISQTDIICLPSYYQGEGYAGIIFEAMHCGKPVLISNWKSLPDLIYGNSGVLVDIKSKESILLGLTKIEKIIKKQEFVLDLNYISEQFDSQKLFNRLISTL